MSGAPKAVAPASETKDVTPHALSTSWLPRSVTTRPPAAAACILRLRSSARHSASCGPRSSTSPHCTSTASPPVHLAVASTKPAVRSTLTKASQSPWRSPTATVRDGAGRRILSTALGSAAGLRVERSSAGRAAEKARRGTSISRSKSVCFFANLRKPGAHLRPFVFLFITGPRGAQQTCCPTWRWATWPRCEPSSPGGGRAAGSTRGSRPTDTQDTLLTWAARHGQAEAVRLLLEAGASVGATDGDDAPALLLACEKECLECARLLLEAGAAVDQADEDGATPLLVACHLGHLENTASGFLFIAHSSHGQTWPGPPPGKFDPSFFASLRGLEVAGCFCRDPLSG